MGSDGALYRELIVWQKSMQLVTAVYELMKKFPKDERFRLCDQLARAVVSIPSNIAEGNGRISKKDYVHFLTIARGSLFETMTQLEIAVNLGFIDIADIPSDLAAEVRRMLNSMISGLRE
jgi:four helix bundle protein